MSMWIVELFRMSVDTSCDVLVYMTILWIVDFLFMNELMKLVYYRIFCIMNGLF